MEVQVLSGKVVHRVQFAPDPNNKSHPTTPHIVETRSVCDIRFFPEGVNYVSFDDIIVTIVSVDGVEQEVESKPFNDSGVHHVVYDRDKAELMVDRNKHHQIEVHSTLQGKIWVFGDMKQFEAQKAAV